MQFGKKKHKTREHEKNIVTLQKQNKTNSKRQKLKAKVKKKAC